MKNIKKLTATIILITGCVLFTSCNKTNKNTNPCNASYINNQMKDMLHELSRVDEEGYVYKISYTYDYYDKTITDLLKNMAPIDTGCSAFTTYNEDNDFMFCRNYDYNHLDPSGQPTGVNIAVSTQKENKLKSIGMCDAYWLDTKNYYKGVLDDGKTDISPLVLLPYMCVDGMNEAGVSVGLFALDTKEGESPTKQSTGKEQVIHSVLLRYILDNAHNIEEAINIAKSYDIVSSANIDLHMMISDKNGNSAVLEWRQYGEDTEQKLYVTYTNAVTNFFVGFDDGQDMYYKDGSLREKLSKVTGTVNTYHYGYGHGYHRFNGIVSAVDRYIDSKTTPNKYGVKNSKMLSIQAANILSVAAQEPGLENTSLTQYSSLYNLNKKTLTLYSERNYKTSYSFNI